MGCSLRTTLFLFLFFMSYETVFKYSILRDLILLFGWPLLYHYKIVVF